MRAVLWFVISVLAVGTPAGGVVWRENLVADAKVVAGRCEAKQLAGAVSVSGGRVPKP